VAVTEVVMPSMGADMTEGSIARWLKGEGDEVKRGDVLAEVETDKAVVEMEAYASGLLRKVIVPEGVTVPVGQVIAFIGNADDPLPEVAAPTAGSGQGISAPSSAPAQQAAPAQPAAAPEPQPAPAPQRPPGERIKASPLARKLAAEKGVDLQSVAGTGPGGRIVKADIEAAASAPSTAGPTVATGAAQAPQPAPLAGEDIPLTNMRRAIARTVVKSKTEAPDFWVTVSIDMTGAMALRSQLNNALADEGVKISVNDMILKAVALSIEKYPKWNTSFDGDKLTGHENINIGVAIALEQGLMVPAILRCQGKSLKQLAQEAHDLGRRARSGGLSQAELTGGTFSISNLGMFGIDEFSAIMMPPQPGILAVGAVIKTPVVRDDEIVAAQIMKATLTVDHRVADGAEAAVFVNEIRRLLEHPLALLL